jgi:hypothetical protein
MLTRGMRLTRARRNKRFHGRAEPSRRLARARRRRILLGLAIFTASCSVAPAASANSFATNYLNHTCCNLRGFRSDIRLNSMSSASGHLALARIFAQKDATFTSGLIQIGYGTSYGSGDPCGSFLGVRALYTYIKPLQSEVCGVVASPPAGTTHRFSVIRVLVSCGGCWQAYFDGSSEIPTAPNVGFDTSDFGGAGGEVDASSSSVSVCYGCAGSTTPFQRATTIGGTDWFTIGQAYQIKDSGWTLGPAPSPFGMTFNP